MSTDKDSEKSEEAPDFADESEITSTVPIERKNTLKRIREDYDEPWKGVLREALQNAGDAWGRNMSRGVLADDSELQIQFTIDTSTKTLVYRDNAGGMTRDVLVDNLIGIDTPDEDKEAGQGAGAYGRGFYVISMCGGGRTYVETRQNGDHYAATVTNDGKYSEPKTPANPRLESDVQGTYIHVNDVLDHDIKNLGDWDLVEDVLIENFTFLLLRDNVSVEFVIDGEAYTPTPPDMKKYLEEGQLIYKGELPKFSAEGGEYQARDLYVIRTDVMDEDPPWAGVAMLKGNKYLDAPFMTVKSYKPTGIPSLRQPAQMIGWCDASDMCPDLENNAHTSFRGHESKTGIKDVLMELHRDHFKKGRSTEERQELASDITESINELLLEYDDFNDYQVHEGEFTEEVGGDEEEGKGEDETPTPPSPSILKVQAGNRDFDVGDTVPLEAQIENPKDSGYDQFEIYDIKISSTDLGMNRGLSPRMVSVPENDHDTFEIQSFRPTEEGIYSFSAKIRQQPEVVEMDDEEPEELDKSRIIFYVGDVEPPKPKNRDNNRGGDEDSENVSIVRGTTFYTADDDNWKAVVSDNPDGGLDVTINANRPEWLSANRITDDKERRDQIQRRLGTKWGVEEAILHRNIDAVHDLLGDYTVDGENAAEVLEDQLKERAEMFAKMESSIVDRYGLEYQS